MTRREVARDPELESARTDPDKLAALLTERVRDGAARAVVAWAEHLFRIDPDPQRRYALTARVLTKAGQFSKAEKILERYEKLYGEDAVVLVARADIAEERKLTARTEELLWSALQKQPDDAVLLERFLAAAGTNRREALERAATLPGARRARLYLAHELIRDLEYDRADDIVTALYRETEDDAVRGTALALLLSSGLTERALRHATAATAAGYATSINLAHAYLAAGRLDDAKAALQKLGEAERSAPEARAMYEIVNGPDASKPDAHLLEAIANAARMDSPKSRQRFYRKLLNARLLVPIALPLAQPLTPPSPQRPPFNGTHPITRITSDLTEVVLCFTHTDALRAWSPSAHAITAEARALFRYALDAGELEVALNPAGPTSVELWRKELSALADGEIPPPSDPELLAKRSYFLIEQLESAPDEKELERLRSDLAEYPEITEAYLIEVVHERHGRMRAVAAVFSPNTNSEQRRDVLLDLIDPSVHPQRKRRVHFFELPAALATEVRRRAVWLIEA